MKSGDIVKLKLGHAHEMTVLGPASGDDNAVICQYFMGTELMEENHAIADLEMVQENLFPIKIGVELAGKEVVKWLDHKRVKPVKRAAYQGMVGTLVQAVMYGEIEIKPDFTIVHNLNVPLNSKDGNSVVLSKLEYAPRLTAQALNECLGQVGNEGQSEIANTIAYGAALSGIAIDIVGKLDTTDIGIIAAISVFFT